MPGGKLPRSGGQKTVVLTGAMWDEICARIEWLEGITAVDGSGIEVHEEPGGPVIGGRLGGDSFLKFVWLDHLSDGVYDAYAEFDPDLADDPVAESVEPSFRPFGTAIDFTQYAETGIGYYNEDQEFILLFAIEERYDISPCPDA